MTNPRVTVMKSPAGELAREYASILQAYLAAPDETSLHRAYELGRRALAGGLGILQMAELHREALAGLLHEGSMSDAGERAVRLGQSFLTEVLSPFDMSQRQIREASDALRRLNETLEAEVKRIAHSLHDEAAQLLVSVDLAVDEAAFGLPARVRDRFEKIRAPLRQCAAELRRLSHELRPPVLDDLGLVPALEFLAEGVAHRLGIPVAVNGSLDQRPPTRVETAVYRVVQEALANVAKHAHAKSVVIDVHRTNHALHCSIRDDGDGFDIAAVLERPERRGLGLLAIRERLNAVGGTHQVVAVPGKGTELLLSVPL